MVALLLLNHDGMLWTYFIHRRPKNWMIFSLLKILRVPTIKIKLRQSDISLNVDCKITSLPNNLLQNSRNENHLNWIILPRIPHLCPWVYPILPWSTHNSTYCFHPNLFYNSFLILNHTGSKTPTFDVNCAFLIANFCSRLKPLNLVGRWWSKPFYLFVIPLLFYSFLFALYF